MNPPARVNDLPAASVNAARNAFRSLCERFVSDHPNSSYVDYIGSALANKAVMERQIRAFQLYAPYVEEGMRVLDWGCRHAPDSCMLRAVFPALEIAGCDTMDDDFSTFHRYAGLDFTRLEHEYRLPYEKESFDFVLSGGVLEHVAFEHESLMEIWRVLKMGGVFAITFLPNSKSWSEGLGRLVGNMGVHNRTYNLSATRNMLLRQGFSMERSGYHQIFPALGKSVTSGSLKSAVIRSTVPLNRPLERVPAVRTIASNLYLVVRKVNCL